MGGNIDDKKFTIKDDGTIVRGKKCPKCGKELISEGDYCEYCGAKIKGTTSKKGCGKAVLWLFLVAIMIVAAIVIITSLTTSNDNYYEWSEATDTTVAEEFYHEASSWDPDEGSYWGEEEVCCEEAVAEGQNEENYYEKAVKYSEATEWSTDW